MSEATPWSQPLCAKFRQSFAYKTVKDRLPVILTKVIDTLHRDRYSVIAKHEDGSEDIKTVIGKLSELRYRLVTDKPLLPLETSLLDAAMWKDLLANYEYQAGTEATWFSCPWLLCECYFHRKIIEVLENSAYLKTYDPYCVQKQQSFVTCLASIKALGALTLSMRDDIAKATSFASLREDVRNIFEVSLWGNRSDLSLFIHGEFGALQLSGLSSLEALRSFIILNEFDPLFSHLSDIRQQTRSGEATHIDFVLDNSGLELFSDLCLADTLLKAGVVKTVRFHAKALPFYVSDTTAQDFCWTLEMLRSSSDKDLAKLGKQWQELLEEGVFQLKTHFFWTTAYPYHRMAEVAPDLHADLSVANLVIFKGDLNYRKLLADVNWQPSTPFAQALQGFQPATLVAVRTVKADLVAGLAPGQTEALYEMDALWMVTGKYGMIQFHQPA